MKFPRGLAGFNHVGEFGEIEKLSLRNCSVACSVLVGAFPYQGRHNMGTALRSQVGPSGRSADCAGRG